MEKEQTAVEWLEKICNDRGYHLMSEYFKQAKQMEENQSKKDFMAGLEVSIQEAYRIAQKSWAREYKAQEYYNETYKSK